MGQDFINMMAFKNILRLYLKLVQFNKIEDKNQNFLYSITSNQIHNFKNNYNIANLKVPKSMIANTADV